jgi:hypothetical protein
MEQFDTDDILISQPKEEEKKSTITCGQLLLILISCLLSLCALYYLFKTVQPSDVPKISQFDLSK